MTHGNLHIGWAHGDITPPRKTLVQGQFHARISDQVISPLTATALALEVKGEHGDIEQVVFLSCDLAADAFKADLLRELAGRGPGLDPRKLTVNATHTHNAPAMQRGWHEEPEGDPDFMNPDEYREWLAVQLADVVAEAWDGRQPGSISRGFGYAVVELFVDYGIRIRCRSHALQTFGSSAESVGRERLTYERECDI